MLLDPSPLSQTVTPSWTLPLERDVLHGQRRYAASTLLDIDLITVGLVGLPVDAFSPIALSLHEQLFHSKLKTLLFNKSYPDSSSSPSFPPRLISKHHPP